MMTVLDFAYNLKKKTSLQVSMTVFGDQRMVSKIKMLHVTRSTLCATWAKLPATVREGRKNHLKIGHFKKHCLQS